MSSENLLAIWEDLEVGIQSIFNMENIGRERYINLYSQVYDYCTFVNVKAFSTTNSTSLGASSSAANQNGAKLIGLELYRKLKEFLKSHVLKLKVKGDGKTGEDILRYLQHSWSEYSFSAKVLNGVCMYLNRNWVRRQLEEGHKQIHEIYTCALIAWTENMLRPHQSAISEALIKEVEKERMNEQLNHRFLKSIIDCLVEVGRLTPHKSNTGTTNTNTTTNTSATTTSTSTTVASSSGTNVTGHDSTSANVDINFDLIVYTRIFENPFIEKTELFYRIESMDFLSKNEITDYLKRVESRMKEEEQRVTSFIHCAPRVQTLERLNKTLTNTLLANHLEQIMNEFTPLLAAERSQDLRRMFNLLNKIPDAFTQMTVHFENFVYQKGTDAIRSMCTDTMPEPKQYIETILDVYNKNNATVSEAFHSEVRFLKALDKGCERFINKNAVTELAKTPRKTPEFLAKYCDLLLRKSNRDGNTDDLDEILSRFMTVFKYIEDKDVFQSFYSKMLARRLINDLSISDEIEAAMISRLKESCGYEYTAKLQRMFQDKSNSKELNKRFMASIEKSVTNIELNFMVLSSNSWPYSAQEKLVLPQELKPCYECFIQYFGEAHNGRKLNWCFNQGRGDIITSYTKKSYTFQVSTYQIAILMLFNSSLSLTVQEIMDSTQLDFSVVNQILQIFLRAKILITSAPQSSTLSNKSSSKPESCSASRQQQTSQQQQQQTSHLPSHVATSPGHSVSGLSPMDATTASSTGGGGVDDSGMCGSMPDLLTTSVVNLYTDYKNKRIRVNLNLPLKGETKQETEEVISRVDNDRKMAIEACIVRVMKTRKTLKHQELVREVLEQLSSKFNPQVALIKRCILGLIEKEYLRRDSTCKDTYQYLA